MKLPKAKIENIVMQTLDKELLIYDLGNNKAYNLNETSKIIYQACDGQTTFDELNRKYKFNDEIIYLTLDELKTLNLIESTYESPFEGLSRRAVIKKVGLASMILLPLITSVVAPSKAEAASCFGSGTSCTMTSQCCGGVCPGGTVSYEINGRTVSCFNGTCTSFCISNAISCTGSGRPRFCECGTDPDCTSGTVCNPSSGICI